MCFPCVPMRLDLPTAALGSVSIDARFERGALQREAPDGSLVHELEEAGLEGRSPHPDTVETILHEETPFLDENRSKIVAPTHETGDLARAPRIGRPSGSTDTSNARGEDWERARSRAQGQIGASISIQETIRRGLSFNPLGEVRGSTPPPDAKPVQTDFTRQVRAHFQNWDTDHDGFLSRAEIDAVVMNPSVRGKTAAAAATIKRMMDDLEDLSDDNFFSENGFTLQDLELYERHMSQDRAARPKAVNSVEAQFSFYVARIQNAPTSVFPTGQADINAMRQGSIGDCYLHAVLGSLVAQDPTALNNMIRTRTNGSYDVTFPGQKTVNVDALTDGEIALYGSAGRNGLWLPILEKAFGKIRGDTIVPADAAEGGHLSESTRIMTGHEPDTDALLFSSNAELERKLSDAMANKRAVSADSFPGFFSDRDDGIVLGHAFSVIGHDPAKHTITLRNPWGHQEFEDAKGAPRDGIDDGIFTMTYDQFHQHFRYITFEQAQ